MQAYIALCTGAFFSESRKNKEYVKRGKINEYRIFRKNSALGISFAI